MIEANPQGRVVMTDKHFIDWENHVFGFGYGSGERHVLGGIKVLFESLDPGSGGYQSVNLEKIMGALSAWLLINALCHADILEYGTSPRNGWLSHDRGVFLKQYMDGKSVDDLYAVLGSVDPDHDYCEPYACSCPEKQCDNPLFGTKGNPHRIWTPRELVRA